MESGHDPAWVIAGLLRPEAYPHPADALRLHETHGAWVILAGAYAYKLKKPVNFGFFDFSTFERRAADAEEEVRLNRRLAPATYLGVVDVVERDGGVRVGGPGRVLERAVWMRRLPADGMLKALLERDAATTGLIRRIARMVAAFHARAATGPGVDEHGAYANVQHHWRENFDQIKPFVGTVIPAGELGAIEQYVDDFLRREEALLERRVAAGRVRDGHGDLHAASICLVGGQLVIFDCIEFAPRYRCLDVAAEVAFLAMDLDHAGRPDLAWTFVAEYVRASGDAELLELLDFYKCYRAFVRGKVLSLRLPQMVGDDAEGERITREARAYLDLASVYAGGIPRPFLLVTSGLPGSGKSTLGRALSQRVGALQLSTDMLRKQAAGLAPTARAGGAFGSGIYTADRSRRTYAALRRRASRWLRRGVSVALDGTYGDPRERRLARALARRTSAHFLLVLTRCDEATTRRRLQGRALDAARVSDATWEVYQRMRDGFVPPEELPAAELIVDETAGDGADAVIARLAAGTTAGGNSK